MLTGITLEQARERAPKWLWRKIEHSIELLRKAEKLALTYDKDDGFYLAFSAGKDSQALYHIAELAGVKFKGHINWTSVDPPQVIRFKRKHYPEVIEHKPTKSIYTLAVEKAILPSMRIRWCCAELKESAGAGKVTLIGIRKEESTRRAKRHEVEVSNKHFSGDFEEFEKWQQTELRKREERLVRKMKRDGKKVNEDEFSLIRENEVRCINGKDSILVSPIFEWTERDVWEFLNKVVQVPHCELYDQGYKRIGCILCPMSQHRQKLRELKDFPHVKHKWIEAIKAIRAGGGIREHQCHTNNVRPNDGITPRRRIADGYIWWNIPAKGTARNAGGMLRNWERNHPNGKPSGDTGTARQWELDGRQCSCSARKSAITPPTASGRNKCADTRGECSRSRHRTSLNSTTLEQESQHRHLGGFSDSPSLNGIRGGKPNRLKTKLPRKFSTGG